MIKVQTSRPTISLKGTTDPVLTVQTRTGSLSVKATGLRGPRGEKGDKGDPSTVPGPVGPASTVPGPRGADSTMPGPKGDKGDPGVGDTASAITFTGPFTVASSQTQQANFDKYSNDANAASIGMRKSRGTVGAPQAIQAGDALGNFVVSGWTGNAWSAGGRFRITASTVTDIASGNYGTDLGVSLRDPTTGTLYFPFNVYGNGNASLTGGLTLGGNLSSNTLTAGGNAAFGALVQATGQVSTNSSFYSNAAKSDTIFTGSQSATANLIGTGAYWAMRTAMDNSVNLDVYNLNSPLTALKVAQNGEVRLGGNLAVAGSATLATDLNLSATSRVLFGTGAAFSTYGDQYIFGVGDGTPAGSPNAPMFRAPDASGAADVAGGDIRFAAGRSTGSGVGGRIRFATSRSSASGGTNTNVRLFVMDLTPTLITMMPNGVTVLSANDAGVTLAGNTSVSALTVSGNITLGNTTIASTATPVTIEMGGTYSTAAGQNLKLKLFNSGTTNYGLGISNNQIDYVMSDTGSHVFYTNSAERARINANGLTSSVKINTPASSAARASMNIPNGVAPTSPANGDLWATSAGFFMRMNGVTYQINATAV